MAVDVTTATRLRHDGVETKLGNDLAQGVTVVEFSEPLTADGGAPIATLLANEYLVLSILDPVTYRLAEIVYLTDYTTNGLTGTIERGAEGTLDVAHNAGSKVVHATTAMDFVLVQDHDESPGAHPEILEAANAYTDAEIVSHNQPDSGAHPGLATTDGPTFTGDVIFEGNVQIDGILNIPVGATLVVDGTIQINGRLILNGREITAANTPPATPSANAIHIQTFG